jgi:hypothetical protein
MSKTPTLLFKLDITKVFDSVRYDYLMDLLQHMSFPSKFKDWVAALLVSSPSRVLLNAIASDPNKYGRGQRQGDPLSPLLFVMAIDHLHSSPHPSQSWHIEKFRQRAPMIHTSLYVDDAAIFMAPYKDDINFLASTLHHFGDVTGLFTDCAKSQVAPIICAGLDLDNIL